jgi:hypothetical protein
MIELAPDKRDFESANLLPQAVIARSPSHLADTLKLRLDEGIDDLDFYVGLNLILDNNVHFAVRHYRGHPSGTSTIYLPSSYNDANAITELVTRIVRAFQMRKEEIIWQRADDVSL